ncbi:ABC transporter substrate-binding protein [Rhodococcus sp. NPDC058521]|uniref:ABC transporter substrate-binding protein n=1 Tax=Rhodococcus sp. NPDC058521 TaxID=3346536 RepID=UPI00364F5DB4
MDRRDFLRASIVFGAVSAAIGTTAACSTESDTSRGSSTLRIAAFGNPTDELNLTTATSPSVYLAAYNIWDSLALLVGDEVRYQLAESIEPNSDATEWTIRLEDGLKFSDGSPITSDDALASILAIAKSPNAAQFWSDLDTEKSRAVDPATTILVLRRPRADFVLATLALMSPVMPKGESNPQVGSGAYRLESGTASTGYVLVPSEHYYGPKPSLTRVEVRTVPDTTARRNALTGGQVDLALGLSSTDAQTLSENDSVQVITNGGGSASALTLVMNTRTAPFDDAELRRAMTAAIDRRQLVDIVFGGQGEVGNDLIGLGLPGYDNAITQRQRDKDYARKVFADKGMTELTLKSSEIIPGMNSAAELVKQQLSEIGVNLTIDQVDPTTFYADIPTLLSTPFLTSYYVNRPVAASLPFMAGATSSWNFSGFTSPALESALQSAQAETDEVKRQEFYDAAQRELYENGAEAIWGYQKSIDGAAKGVQLKDISQGLPLLATATFN